MKELYKFLHKKKKGILLSEGYEGYSTNLLTFHLCYTSCKFHSVMNMVRTKAEPEPRKNGELKR